MNVFQTDNLEFNVKNLGSVHNGKFTIKPLTIFCGPNNSGKTWTMYSLYYFYVLLKLEQEYEKEGENRNISLRAFNKKMSTGLVDLFNASEKSINNAQFEIKISEQNFTELLKTKSYAAFLMPAERSGLHLFFRELSTRRTALLHHASKENIDIIELLRDVIKSRYAVPIADYIDWLNNLSDIKKSKSKDFHVYAEQLKRQLAGGAYKVDAQTGSIEFKPYQQRYDGIKTEPMGLHIASSTVKSLFGLWFYLEYQAERGHILMIDEPELNIHPSNQRKIARLLAQLVNAGLNVVVSTHSDYMVREFNSLIMLSQDERKILRKRHKYFDNELLNVKQVGAYLFDKQKIEPFEITPDDGIYASTFDVVISDLNKTNDDIYYNLKEIQDAE